MSISSTSPTLPSESSSASLTVNFNRDLTTSEKNNFSATLVVKDSSTSLSSKEYSLSSGTIIHESGGSTTQVGTYAISGSTLSVTLNSAKYLVSFALDDD